MEEDMEERLREMLNLYKTDPNSALAIGREVMEAVESTEIPAYLRKSWEAQTLFEEPKEFSETEFHDFSNITSGFSWEENLDKWILTIDGKQYESNYSHLPAKLKKKKNVKYFVMERAGPVEACNMTNIAKYKKAYNIENLAIRCFKPTNKNDESFYILLEDIVDLVESLSDEPEENYLLQTFKNILEEQPDNFHEAKRYDELSTFFESLDIDKTQVTIIPDFYQDLTMQKTRKEFFTPIKTFNSYGTVVMETSEAMLHTFLHIVIGIDWFKAEQKIGTDSMNEFKNKFFALMKTYEDKSRITFVSKHHVDKQIEIIRKDEVYKQLVRKIPECFKDGQNMNNEVPLTTHHANLTCYSLPIYAARMKIFKLSMQWYSHIFSWINSFYLHNKLSQKVILMQALFSKMPPNYESPDDELKKDAEYWTEETTDLYKEVMAGVVSGKPNVFVTNYETVVSNRRMKTSKTSQQKSLEVLLAEYFLDSSKAPPPGSVNSNAMCPSTSTLSTPAKNSEPVAAKTPEAPPLPLSEKHETPPTRAPEASTSPSTSEPKTPATISKIPPAEKPVSPTVADKAPSLEEKKENDATRPNDAKYWRDKCFTAGEHCSEAQKAQKSAEKKAKEYETKAKRTEEVEKEMKRMKKEMEKLKKELDEANRTVQKNKEKEMKLREELKREKESSEAEKLILEATNKSLEDKNQCLKSALARVELERDEAQGKLQEFQTSQPSTSGPSSYKSKLEELMQIKREFEKRQLKIQSKDMAKVLTTESDDPAIKEMVNQEMSVFMKSYDNYLNVLLQNILNLNKFLGTRPLIPLPAEPVIPEKLCDAYLAHIDPHKPLIAKNECHFCYGLIEPSARTAHCGHEKCEAILHFECARNWYTTGTTSVECMYCKEPFLDIKAVKQGAWRC